jgi:hypothetical protein
MKCHGGTAAVAGVAAALNARPPACQAGEAVVLAAAALVPGGGGGSGVGGS